MPKWTSAKITALLDDDRAVNRAITRLYTLWCNSQLTMKLGDDSQLQRLYVALSVHGLSRESMQAARKLAERYVSTLVQVANEKEGMIEWATADEIMEER